MRFLRVAQFVHAAGWTGLSGRAGHLHWPNAGILFAVDCSSRESCPDLPIHPVKQVVIQLITIFVSIIRVAWMMSSASHGILRAKLRSFRWPRVTRVTTVSLCLYSWSHVAVQYLSLAQYCCLWLQGVT
jgi:hypothetical protein